MKIYIFIAFIGVSFFSLSQLDSKMKKMIGEWEFRNGSGLEIWKQENDQLHGYEYRMSKFGDTVRVEEMTIHFVNKNLVYTIDDHRHSTTMEAIQCHEKMRFVGDRRDMKFYNIDEHTPYSIQYSFGFFNRDKMKIKIQSGQKDKPVKLILLRVKHAS